MVFSRTRFPLLTVVIPVKSSSLVSMQSLGTPIAYIGGAVQYNISIKLCYRR